MALDDGLLYLALAAIGATTGVLTGLTGASGMSLLISGLLLLGVEIRDIIGLTFVVTLVNSAVALGPYWRHGRVDLRTALWVAIPAMLAVVAGHFVARRVTSGALTNGITAALFCVGWRFLLAPAEPPHAAPSAPARPPAWALLGLGLAAGLAMGVMGGGGAVFIGIALMLLFRMPAPQAIGTSVLIMGLAAVPGVAAHSWSGTIRLGYAAVLLLPAIPAAWVGGVFANRISPIRLRRILGLYLVVVSTALVIKRLLAG